MSRPNSVSDRPYCRWISTPMMAKHYLGALIYGHPRLDPKYFPRVSHQPRKFFPIYHVRRRSEFFVPRQTT